jgi:hypothetical protein
MILDFEHVYLIHLISTMSLLDFDSIVHQKIKGGIKVSRRKKCPSVLTLEITTESPPKFFI